MITIFKDMIKTVPEDIHILSVNETSSKYKITALCIGQKAKTELSKTCYPKEEKKVCWKSIVTLLSTAYINDGDLKKAKEWLDKLTTFKD